MLSRKINNSVAFSIIMDETTDISTEKTLVLVVRFFDSAEGRVQDNFFGLIKISNGTAAEIHSKTIEHLRKNNIPLHKMIGFAADNACVMMGNIKGVKALFQKDNNKIIHFGLCLPFFSFMFFGCL